MLNEERGRRYILRFHDYDTGRIFFGMPGAPAVLLGAIALKLEKIDGIFGAKKRELNGREFVVIVLTPPIRRRPRRIVEVAREIAAALLEVGNPYYSPTDPRNTKELSIHEWARGM